MSEKELVELHKKCKKLSVKELCQLLLGVYEVRLDPSLIKIMKTYLYRRLKLEGIQ